MAAPEFAPEKQWIVVDTGIDDAHSLYVKEGVIAGSSR